GISSGELLSQRQFTPFSDKVLVKTKMLYDLVAFGETMIALAPPPGEIVRRTGYLLVDHAGAESNTCVGLARLGLRVAWVSRLGADAAGERILESLSGEGIDTQWVGRDPARATGLMLKEPGTGVRYYRSGSAASAMGPDALLGVPVAEARAVLVTGVTALIGSEPHAAALAFLGSARGLRIVDPNLRTGLWGSDRRAELVRPLIDRCDLLLAGASELLELVGDGDDGSAKALAERAQSRGPREVVVRGAASVGVLTADGWQELEIRRDDAVDPIGAGDAFNAGYIAVRLRGGPINEALRAGVRCGAAVTTSPSDTAGFPRSI
ncbi:MAG TPA: sugar kinase, partial [Vicinamibacterales bacterium]|nr:sugar kinase [Vicinamibacterales bacterium]